MNVETLHDALTLLPADLVAEADRYRGRKGRVIPWKRYAAMAACLVAVVGGTLMFRQRLLGGMMKSAANDTAMPQAMMAQQTPTEMAPENGAGVPETAAEKEGASAVDAGPAERISNLWTLTEPPMLTLTAGTASATVEGSGYTWDVLQEDGSYQTVVVCGAVPTDDPEALPLLDAETPKVQFAWDTAPQSYTILYWADEESEPLDILTTESAYTLEKGGIYEVTAYWTRGTATYAFRMNANWEG